jgi:hypothetical protein
MVVRPAPSGQSEFDTAHLGNHLGPPMGPRQTTAIVIEQSGSWVEQAKPGAEADPVPQLSLRGSVDIVPPLAPPVFPIRIAGKSHLDISIRQLAPTFAGEVTGVDCRRPLSPDQVAAIHAAWPNTPFWCSETSR